MNKGSVSVANLPDYTLHSPNYTLHSPNYPSQSIQK